MAGGVSGGEICQATDTAFLKSNSLWFWRRDGRIWRRSGELHPFFSSTPYIFRGVDAGVAVSVVGGGVVEDPRDGAVWVTFGGGLVRLGMERERERERGGEGERRVTSGREIATSAVSSGREAVATGGEAATLGGHVTLGGYVTLGGRVAEEGGGGAQRMLEVRVVKSWEKSFSFKLFSNEVHYTNSLIFLVENMLCGKLHCQRFQFNPLVIF